MIDRKRVEWGRTEDDSQLFGLDNNTDNGGGFQMEKTGLS